MRWVLTPFIAIFAVAMPLLIDEWTPARIALMAVMEFMCVAVLAGFWLPPRFGQWAFRGFAGAVFLCYAAYFIHEWFFTNEPFRISERKSAASPRNALLGFIIIGLPCLWYAVMGRLTKEPSREEEAAERQEYEKRILEPDWEFYERHLQRPVPTALRELYADRALVTAGGLKYDKRGWINTFHPLREEGLLDTRDEMGTDIVAFATSECGDPIYLRPGASEADTVYITYHDGGETEVFAESVAAMLETLRKTNRDIKNA